MEKAFANSMKASSRKIKELKEKDWPMPAIVTNETLKMEAQIADMVAH